MIATIAGVVVEKSETSVVIETAGIGYEVVMASSDYQSLSVGGETRVYIYEVIREDAHDLYGFLEPTGKDIFKQLLSVSGVGPKAAVAILSISSIDKVQEAITVGDVDFLQSADGVGKRTAERIAVELKDKLISSEYAASSSGTSNDTALEALEALGYSRSIAMKALSKISKDLSDEDRIKQALGEMQ
ncbi:MAG: Holliday junction branch migration protein RuvA [Candidatus Saccharimonadales bacterium]